LSIKECKFVVTCRSLKMSTTDSESAPMSHGSQPETDSRVESINESEANQSEAIEIEDDEEEIDPSEEEDGAEVGSKRKLTSIVWKEFKRVKWHGKIKAKCNYCFAKLGGDTRSGTKHLHDHMKSCIRRKIKYLWRTTPLIKILQERNLVL